MSKAQISQAVGFAAVAVLLIGAGLYAVDSPHRGTAATLLLSGVILAAAYAGLNLRSLRAFAGTRSARYGANTIVMIVLFTCVVIIVQAISIRHSYQYDITSNKRFSLAGQTESVLASLQEDLQIYAFYTQGSAERQRVEDLLELYSHRSPRVHYEFIDPERNPTRAEDMDVSVYDTIVLQRGTRRETVSHVTEELLTNAILRIRRDVTKRIYIVVGHGEKDISDTDPSGYSILHAAVEKQNYEMRQLSLFEEESVPEDCYVLLVAGPRKDYFESEIQKMNDYLNLGKNAVFLIDPKVSVPNIEAVLHRYRAALDNDVVIDPYSRVFGGDVTIPVVTQYVEHPITRDIDVATFFPMARSVRISTDEAEGVTAQYLAQTGKTAWGETDLEGVRQGKAARDDNDVAPPVPVAMLSSMKLPSPDGDESGATVSKIVLFGDSDFIDNSSFRLSGNGDLFLNVINFLAEEKDLIAIRPQEGLGNRLFLTASQGRLVFLLSVVILPLSVISFGISIFLKRRRMG